MVIWASMNIPYNQETHKQCFFSQLPATGPFWMTEQRREETRNIRMLEGQTQKKKVTKVQLIKKLQENGVTKTGKFDNI